MKRILIVAMLVSSFVFSQTMRGSANQNGNDEPAVLRAHTTGRIEPKAGNWRTWVISSGKDYRVPPPPGRQETRAELKRLAELISQNDEQVR